ncbi:hypothetical protein U5686_001254 [Campylobacter coli]|nr:hypothetical protein [Campylobacter coli]
MHPIKKGLIKMDDKDLNLLKNIPYLMEKIEELENRIKQLEQAAQPKPYSTQNPNYLGEI